MRRRISTGLVTGSVLNCADNTGARKLKMIQAVGYKGVRRRLPPAGVGDLIIVSCAGDPRDEEAALQRRRDTAEEALPEARRDMGPVLRQRRNHPHPGRRNEGLRRQGARSQGGCGALAQAQHDRPDGGLMKKGITKPGTNRKRRFNAPHHVNRKFFSAPLSPSLKTEHGTRSMPVIKDDTVQVTVMITKLNLDDSRRREKLERRGYEAKKGGE